VRGAAAELEHISLSDALAICLVLLDDEPGLFERAGTRWTARYCRTFSHDVEVRRRMCETRFGKRISAVGRGSQRMWMYYI
jgi:hypothetical protein